MTDHFHPAVARAIEAVAEATGLPPARIEVVAVEPERWRSAALGCPEPGMMYAQVMVSGFRVRLRGPDGQTWTLHTDQGQRAIFAPPPDAQTET